MKACLILCALVGAASVLSVHARDLKGNCLFSCPTGYYSVPTTAGSACPICYWPGSSSYCGKYTDAFCCGGESQVTCPMISCSTTSATAISGSQGCSIAVSSMSATSKSASVLALKTVLVEAYKDVCKNTYTYTNGYTETVTADITASATAAVSKAAEVMAKTITNYYLYACTCARCSKYPCPTYVNTARAKLDTVVTAVAEVCLSASTQAIAEVAATGCIDGDYNAYAFAMSTAMAQSVEATVQNYTKEIYSYDSYNCQTYAEYNRVTKVFAKALVCSISSVYAKIASRQVTTTTYDAAGMPANVTSNGSTNTTINSCSYSKAIAGSLLTYVPEYVPCSCY